MFSFDLRAAAGNHHYARMLTLSLFALVLSSAAAIGQTVTGSISGTVTDPNGAVVAGAAVTLLNDRTKDKRDQVSNEGGRFSFAAIQPGVYTVKIEHQGFETLLRTKVVLSANEDLALGDVPLKTGQVTETVTVQSEGQVVEKESSDLTARLTSDQISLISTKGRDITSLLRLIPGTSNDDDIEAVGEGFGTNLPNISGQRGRSTVTTVDGLNASEPSGSNKISMTTNQDAIAEVKVLRNNYAAEYGNNGGAMINIVTKGGSKDYRGSAYYFVRNESLNASPFFTNKASLPKPLYRHHIPGFNIGGPLPLPRFAEGGRSTIKGRAFFFFSMEKPHTITPTDPVTVTVPTALERLGDFSKSVASNGSAPVVIDPLTGSQFPGNVIPASRIDRSMQNLLNFFPLPNSPIATNPGRYVNQNSVDVPKHSYDFRIDFKLTNKDNVYWKAQWWTSDNLGLGTSGWPSGDANRWGILSHYLYKDNGWPGSINWVHIFNSRVVNEFNAGMRHDSEGFIPGAGIAEKLSRTAIGYTAPQIFPQNNRMNLVPIANGWSSVAGTPANINWLNRWGETGNDYIRPSFADNISFIHGNHAYKFGMYFERLLNSEAPGGNWSGTLSFSTSSSFTTALGSTGYAYANALLGNFNSYTEQSSRPFTNNEIHLLQWYAQDEWKFNRRLTLSYGMRWGYHTPFFQRDTQGSNFDPSRYDPAKAPLLYFPFCTVALTNNSCPTANRRAVDPRNLPNPTAAQLLTNVNLVGTFIPGTGDLANGIVSSTDPNAPPGFRKTASIDWEPRVGLAYDIFGRGKTVLRLMGGVYHSPRVGGGTGGASSLGGNPPLQRTFTVNFGNVENLLNLIGGALNAPSTVAALEVNSNTPLTYNFTAGVQQDIGYKTVLEVSYVGSLARHLGERRNINQVPDGMHFIDGNPNSGNCNPDPSLICRRNPFGTVSVNGTHLIGVLADNFLRPYKGYGDINLTTWSGTSNYNGLQVQVNRRYTRNFQYGVAYTWSKTFDYANDDNSDVSNGRPYKVYNYGPADFDQTHILTANYIYDLPNLGHRWNSRAARLLLDNWQVSGTTSFATGKPKTFGSNTGLNWTFSGGSYAIKAGESCAAGFVLQAGSTTTCTSTTTTDFSGGDINARPVLVCNPNHRPGTVDSTGTPYMIDTSCFAKPTAAGQIGTLPRNFIRLPSIFNNDVAVFKNIRVGERREVQLRWEVYNVFNRANFTDINGAMTFAINTTTAAVTGGTCPSGFSQLTATVCGGPDFGKLLQTNNTFGTPRAARSPRVMQGSIRINF